MAIDCIMRIQVQKFEQNTYAKAKVVWSKIRIAGREFVVFVLF